MKRPSLILLFLFCNSFYSNAQITFDTIEPKPLEIPSYKQLHLIPHYKYMPKEYAVIPTRYMKLDSFVIEKGVVISLPNVIFYKSSSKILKEGYKDLDYLAKVLSSNPSVEIQLLGHICCRIDGYDAIDPDTGIFELSFNRAKFVYEYLVNKGINASRLSYQGFGSLYKLKEDSNNPEFSIINRRVEALIVAE